MYETPTPEELKAYMEIQELTYADIAAMSGVSLRTAQRWTQPRESKEAKAIPWAAWAMVMLLSGMTTEPLLYKVVDDWKKTSTGRGLKERSPTGRPLKID